MLVRNLASAPYSDVLDVMRAFTHARTANTEDELWLVEHPAVSTVGQRPQSVYPKSIGAVSVIPVDRGGDIALHAPEQLVAYPLLDLRRAGLLVRNHVSALQETIIDTLTDFGLQGVTVPKAPGVYIVKPGEVGAFAGLAKIASLGVKIHNGCTYHGIALNIAMDLQLFTLINPCRYRQLRVTDMKTKGAICGFSCVAASLSTHLPICLEHHARH